MIPGKREFGCGMESIREARRSTMAAEEDTGLTVLETH